MKHPVLYPYQCQTADQNHGDDSGLDVLVLNQPECLYP